MSDVRWFVFAAQRTDAGRPVPVPAALAHRVFLCDGQVSDPARPRHLLHHVLLPPTTDLTGHERARGARQSPRRQPLRQRDCHGELTWEPE